jgi:saccharopine dehydrogenase (NAD+, L-lysine-forming)
MSACIGIRREDKSDWERRVAITPAVAGDLKKRLGIEVVVQPSPTRAFTEDEFRAARVELSEDLSACPVIFGIKEMPKEVFQPGKTYVFFSHVVKGQSKNMPMLRRMMDLGCNLLDYEKVTDDRGRRLIFFGRHAGLAGMIDTLWALGKRLEWEGIPNALAQVQRAYEYHDLAEAETAIRSVGEQIKREGLPRAVTPLIVGMCGYGNVSRGAQEILDLLPVQEIPPADIIAIVNESDPRRDVIYKVVFREADTVVPLEDGRPFDLKEYYAHPELYRGVFSEYLPHLSVVVNCIYWESKYPRLITKDDLRTLWQHGTPRLRVIGDISIDIEGAIECTVRATDIDDPVYVYDPLHGYTRDGVAGRGPVVLAVDILPSELPRDSSVYFSGVLEDYVPAIAAADFSVPWEELQLPDELKRAIIIYHGELTPVYRYLERYVKEKG